MHYFIREVLCFFHRYFWRALTELCLYMIGGTSVFKGLGLLVNRNSFCDLIGCPYMGLLSDGFVRYLQLSEGLQQEENSREEALSELRDAVTEELRAMKDHVEQQVRYSFIKRKSCFLKGS